MNHSVRSGVIIVSCFLMYYTLSKVFRTIMEWVYAYLPNELASYIITYFIIGLPIFVGTLLVSKKEGVLNALGLSSGLFKGIGIGLFFTLPMFIGGTILFHLEEVQNIQRLLKGTFVAGFFEELYFRAFLFGLLFRKTKLGFIPALLLGAIIFATGHLYQSDQGSIRLGIFLVTFIGSGFFAWLYVEWGFNTWIPIFLHAFMNLSWMIFDMSDTAAGSTYANILRAITIALAISITIVYRLRSKRGMAVNGKTLFVNRK